MDELISKARILMVNRATGSGTAVAKKKAGEEWLRPSAGGGTQSCCRSEN